MRYRSPLSFKTIFIVPFFFIFIIFILIVIEYVKNFNDALEAEYTNITHNLSHSVKLLSSLDYNFSVYFNDDDAPQQKPAIQHTHTLSQDDLCVWKPQPYKIQSVYHTDARKVLQLDYAVKGTAEACDPQNPIFQEIRRRIDLAPMFSFLNGITDYILGLYYLSPESYLIGSPSYVVEKVSSKVPVIMKQRTYWKEAKRGISAIRLNGPFYDLITGNRTLTITAGLFHNHEFKGIVAIDIITSKLYSMDPSIGEKIRFINLSTDTLPSNGWKPQVLLLKGVQTNQLIYFDLNWLHEMKSFMYKRAASLYMLLVLYVISLIALIYVKTSKEKRHFENLSQRDPLTSLLNRRGFEKAYHMVKPLNYEGFAIFDIDDFKLVNDNYGHDVGDTVICSVANTLSRNTRASDIVARFGGEEFVIYMQGNNADKMLEALNRVQKEVGLNSTQVLETGFTVSAGVSIQPRKDKNSLEALIKDADIKLYTAKRTGKNKVVAS